ncbi:fimbria/pilus outer membrane usher protein [Rahnella aquatilis]|uniref:fimbria/pilus outer membrane usher protein n=1 Tax=Rahnella aquatilis TaxID=34038 RepID=UPI0036595C83
MHIKYQRIITLFVLLGGASTELHAETLVAPVQENTAAVLPSTTEPVQPISDEDEKVEFDSAFFTDSGVDVSRYSYGNPVLVGKYRAAVLVNDKLRGQFEINFVENPADKLRALPCVDQAFFDAVGIKVDEQQDDKECHALQDWLPDANWKLDVNEQVFSITVPQIKIIQRAEDEVPVSLWDEGVNALTINHNFNYYRSTYSGDTSDSAYLGVDAGLNIAGWRVRMRGDANYSSDTEDVEFDSSNLYAEHDITALKSQLRAGEIYGSSSFFDSFPMRGISLSSDERMLPDSLGNFRPVIRGVAETNARLIIRQKGNTILETTVPPGEFSINDYTTISSSDDLDVTIYEADGRTRSFSIPYNSGARLLYPGVGLYSFSVGEYDQDDGDKPLVGQVTYQYGVNNLVTVYTGAEYFSDYYALLGGMSFNTSVGSISLDMTHSSLKTEDGDVLQGQSLGLTYSSTFSATNTNFDLAAYRYSTESYYDLEDAIYYLDDNRTDRVDNMRSQFQVNISQNLTEGFGSVYTSGSLTEYWASARKEKSYQIGYSNSLGNVNYSVSVNRYYTQENEKDDQIYVSFSIPLGGESKGKPMFDYLSTTYTNSGKGKNHQLSTSASGTNDGQDIYYGVNTSLSKTDNYGQDKLADVGGNISMNTRYGTFGSSVSANTDNSRQLSLTSNGGLLAHSGGVILGRTISSDSGTALVNAKGATGARVNNDVSSVLNNDGYAFVSNLSPYRYNDVSLDPSTMTGDTELKETSIRVVPRAGAVINVPFNTDDRRSVFLIMKKRDGKNIPFGTEVLNEKQEVVGMMGQKGRAFTRGLEDKGRVTARWGDNPDEQCSSDYELPDNSSTSTRQETLILENLICQ